MTGRGYTALRFALGALFTIASLWSTAHADQPAATPRIGVLDPSGSTTWAEGFHDGLRRAGYSEGNNLVVEWWRPAEETEKELQSAARDLVRSRVGLIVALGTPATRAILQSTSLPVVFLVGDPVASGFASSLAKPGGNGTGVSVVTPELQLKRLELLHQLAPKSATHRFSGQSVQSARRPHDAKSSSGSANTWGTD
jgi:ABC-type uncharacterized transport system substrate-binding protein